MEEIPLQQELGEILRGQGVVIAVAESCTGGLLGSLITGVAGSSQYFRGGVIAYDNEIKARLLDVPRELLQRHGAVSEGVARAMAEGVRRLFGADYGISLTGIAGPGGGTPEKPVGTVWIGLDGAGESRARRITISGMDRNQVRQQAACRAMEWLRDTVLAMRMQSSRSG